MNQSIMKHKQNTRFENAVDYVNKHKNEELGLLFTISQASRDFSVDYLTLLGHFGIDYLTLLYYKEQIDCLFHSNAKKH